MKKLFLMLLCLALVLSGSALAGEAKENIGKIGVNNQFSLEAKLPEGYKMHILSQSDLDLIAMARSEDVTKPDMTLIIAADDSLDETKRLNDLTEEELKAIEATFTADYTGEITYMETSYGTKLMVFRETGDDYDFIDFLAYYNGYSIEFIVTPHYVEGEMQGKALTDEDVARAIQFLSDLDFVSAA
jgi:ribosomal protein S13